MNKKRKKKILIIHTGFNTRFDLFLGLVVSFESDPLGASNLSDRERLRQTNGRQSLDPLYRIVSRRATIWFSSFSLFFFSLLPPLLFSPFFLSFILSLVYLFDYISFPFFLSLFPFFFPFFSFFFLFFFLFCFVFVSFHLFPPHSAGYIYISLVKCTASKRSCSGPAMLW